MDSEEDFRSLGESHGEIREGLPRLARSACAQRISRFARHLGHRAGCGAVWRERRHRHGVVRPLEERPVAAISAVGPRHSQPRHVQPGVASAGPASLRANVPAVHGGLRQSQWDQAYRRRGRRRQGPARRLRAGQKCHAAAYGQRLRRGSADGAGIAQGARPRRGPGCLGSAANAVARKLHRYCRCIALPSGVCRHGAQARRSLRAGTQGKSGQAVRCCRAALCPRRQAQCCQTPRTVDARPAGIASCHRHSGHPRGRRKPLPWRGCLGSHHLAQTAAWCARREAGRALLPALQVYGRQTTAADCAQSLGLSRTGCIGCSTWCSTRMVAEPEKATARKTLPSCGGSQSTSFVLTPSAYPCAKKSNAPVGTMPFCSISSATCDSPALVGRVAERSERGGGRRCCARWVQQQRPPPPTPPHKGEGSRPSSPNACDLTTRAVSPLQTIEFCGKPLYPKA